MSAMHWRKAIALKVLIASRCVKLVYNTHENSRVSYESK